MKQQRSGVGAGKKRMESSGWVCLGTAGWKGRKGNKVCAMTVLSRRDCPLRLGDTVDRGPTVCMRCRAGIGLGSWVVKKIPGACRSRIC